MSCEVFRGNKGHGCHFGSITHEKCDHGCSGADITPKFGLLLSRSWAKKVGGTLQMDLSYATIPVFGG